MLELPVGAAVHRYGVPSLAAGGSHEETFTVRTERRGVIAVGPATTRRGDPLGSSRRDVEWTGVTEIFVRPPMVPLESLGAGLLRDLEGVTTDAISQSDLAFHALREYVPGDDLRHVHWRSSAKAMAVAGESSCWCASTSTPGAATPRSWSTTARLLAPTPRTSRPRCRSPPRSPSAPILDDFEASFVCGEHASSGADRQPRPRRGLPRRPSAPTGPGRVGPTGPPAWRPTPACSSSSPGAATDFDDLPARRRRLPAGGTPVRADRRPDRPSRVAEAAGLPVLAADKDDLAALLRWSVR